MGHSKHAAVCRVQIAGEYTELSAEKDLFESRHVLVSNTSPAEAPFMKLTGFKRMLFQDVIRHSKYQVGASPYNPFTAAADIALVILSSDVKLRHGFVTLAAKSQTLTKGQQLGVSGWGYTDAINTSPSKLQFAYIEYIGGATDNADILTSGACTTGNPAVLLPIVPGHFCAGGNGHGACQGDSGGAVVIVKAEDAADMSPWHPSIQVIALHLGRVVLRLGGRVELRLTAQCAAARLCCHCPAMRAAPTAAASPAAGSSSCIAACSTGCSLPACRWALFRMENHAKGELKLTQA